MYNKCLGQLHLKISVNGYFRVLLRGDFPESENILTQIATSESEAAAGELLLDANICLARAVYYLATRCAPDSGANLTGQASQAQVPPNSRNIPQTRVGATGNRAADKAKHDLSPQSRNQVHPQPKRRRNTTAGLGQTNGDNQGARGGMYHSFVHNLTTSRPNVVSVGNENPNNGPMEHNPKRILWSCSRIPLW